MKAGSITIGVVPDIVPEYLLDKDENGVVSFIENSGVWTNDIYTIPMLIGDTVTKFLDDTIEKEVYDKMREIASKYNPEKTREGLEVIYQGILDERALLFKSGIEEYEGMGKEVPE